VFKQALSFAVKRQYIRFNIMEVYELPRKNTYNYTVLSVDEMILLLREILNGENDIKLIIMFMLCYGMRRGECLGLRYSDLSDNVLSIRRTTQFTGGKFLTTDCKTEKSKRDLLLMQEHMSYIETYHRERETNSEGFLMRKEDGSRITQNILQREFKHILERLRLPDIRLHDLRHSYATMMVRNGVNPKIISSVLGHSSIGITMDLYSHADVSMQTTCLGVIGKKFGGGQ
jgi:integrase